MRAILVDDEPIILEELNELLEGSNQIKVAGIYTDPLKAVAELTETKPDCAFLDIEMQGISGVELAEQLVSINPEIEVVFVTAYNHYAAQAFEVNAIDYLLKPIRPERMEKAVEKLIKKSGSKPERQKDYCAICSFGPFEVIAGDHAVKWSRSKSKELLAYLLQHEGKWLSKYKLCDEQWPEYGEKQALAYMQTSLYALRKSIREAGCTQLEIAYADNRYLLSVKDAEWDVRQFETAYEEFMRTGSSEAAEKALTLYRGEYLEGEDWLWSDIIREYYICKIDKLKNVLQKTEQLEL